MPLSTTQQKTMASAIQDYDFPMVAYDFVSDNVLNDFVNYQELERFIQSQLTSDVLSEVRDGLSNVLYWGYATSKGRQSHRVELFRSSVTETQLRSFMAHLSSREVNLQAVKQCKLPQLSNISFVSKVLMFLDPERFVTLDLQLRKLKQAETENLFRGLKDQRTSLQIGRAHV